MRSSVLISSALAAALFASAPARASAQTADGYWSTGTDSGVLWRSGSGLCLRSGSWTPAKAIAACDPDLVPKPKPQPVAAPVPAPAAVPTPPAWPSP